jgi:histidinol dehydrogenase
VQFGDNPPERFELDPGSVSASNARVSPETRGIIERAAENIDAVARAIADLMRPVRIQQDGFTVGVEFRPVERAGCYVPGGRFPLPSTALMTAMTARAAGVQDICIVSPRLTDEVVYAGSLAGVSHFYRIGGAQAIAALAFGTETIPRVDMIGGPGNRYVTEAKRQLQGTVGIDLLAGPSEIAIIADATANPDLLALDLAAQLEHGPSSRAFLFTISRKIAEETVQRLTSLWSKRDIPENHDARSVGVFIAVFSNLSECVVASDMIAPEHLHLHLLHPADLERQPRHYGALFIGYDSTVPFGDYMAGPNHTLPTGGSARFSGALTPLNFLRAQTFVEASQLDAQVVLRTAGFAELEGLAMHAAAVRARMRTLAAP